MKKIFSFIFVIFLILLGIFLLNRPHLSNGWYTGSSNQSELMLNHYDHYLVSNRGQLPSKLQKMVNIQFLEMKFYLITK